MTRRTRRSRPWTVLLLVVLIGGGLYLNTFIVPRAPAFFVPTPTPTRNPESFKEEAKNLFAEGKLLPAIDSYQQAIRANPNDRENYVELAKIQVWAGQYEGALENAEKALIGNEEYAIAHAVRGWALGFQGDYLAAEAALRKAMEIDPNHPLVHAYYAEVLIDNGDYGDIEKAIQESNIAYNLAPNLVETLRARGYILYATGNYNESIEKYQAAISSNKNIADLYLYLGYNYKALGEYDLAIEAFTQANALNPASDTPDLEASRVYALVGDFGKAVQYAELALKDNPTYPHRYGHLGMMYYKAGELDRAISMLDVAIKGGTTEDGEPVEGLPLDYGFVASYYVYYGLALAQTTPNRCAEAVPVFQAILSGVPEDADNVYNANFGLDLCKQAAGEAPSPTEDPTAP